jgi:hypothetical protein
VVTSGVSELSRQSHEDRIDSFHLMLISSVVHTDDVTSKFLQELTVPRR